MAVAILVPTYNILAVITLETCRGGPISLGETLRGVLRNPLVISCALGVLALLFGIRIPEQILGSLEDLGSAGGTLTLVALGASLRLHGLRQQAAAQPLPADPGSTGRIGRRQTAGFPWRQPSHSAGLHCRAHGLLVLPYGPGL